MAGCGGEGEVRASEACARAEGERDLKGQEGLASRARAASAGHLRRGSRPPGSTGGWGGGSRANCLFGGCRAAAALSTPFSPLLPPKRLQNALASKAVTEAAFPLGLEREFCGLGQGC